MVTLKQIKKADKIKVTNLMLAEGEDERNINVTRNKTTKKWDCSDKQSGEDLFLDDEAMFEILDDEYIKTKIVK